MRRVSIPGLICFIILSTASLSLAQDTTGAKIQFWKDSANRGSVIGPFSLGWSYAHGQGVEKDLVEAARWYRLGAERGDFQAALELANMHLEGVGVEKDEKKAIEWYVIIGKSESIYAPVGRSKLLLLARNYSLGDQGVEPNKTKARALFDLLLEVEIALMKRNRAKMHESIGKAEEAFDTIIKRMPKDKQIKSNNAF